jgi:UDP-glucose 4-epimerase
LLTVVSFVPQSARAATWTQIFGDEFNAADGTGVNTANWLYDTGTSGIQLVSISLEGDERYGALIFEC